MTVKEALDVSNRSVSFREAEIFLIEVLGVERAWIHTHPENILSSYQEQKFNAFLLKREENIPVAYIIGNREFYGRKFTCDKRALIPRPETEGLIDRVIKWAPDFFNSHMKASNKPCPVRILELGTGSGNIAISLALELAKLSVPTQIVATDISEEALDLARENWEILKKEVSNSFPAIHFCQADLFSGDMVASRKPYHLLVANLPYVPNDWKVSPEAQAEVVFQEPDVALFGGGDGLDLYRQFFLSAPEFLADDGKVLVEFGDEEGIMIIKLAKDAFPAREPVIHKDYAELDRILEL